MSSIVPSGEDSVNSSARSVIDAMSRSNPSGAFGNVTSRNTPSSTVTTETRSMVISEVETLVVKMPASAISVARLVAMLSSESVSVATWVNSTPASVSVQVWFSAGVPPSVTVRCSAPSSVTVMVPAPGAVVSRV